MATAKSTPRFVPTLTEVVQPDLPVPSPTEFDAELLVAQILQRVIPLVVAELRGSLQVLFQEQRCSMEADLHKEIQSAVQQALLRAQDNAIGK
jgi:hypothetical protein